MKTAKQGQGVRFLAVVVMTWALLFTAGCDLYQEYQRAKQIRTYTDLQVIAHRIESDVENALGRPAIERTIKAVNGGLDAWGHPFIYTQKADDDSGGTTYLLLSVGADGELDVDDLSVYYDAEERSVAWDFDRDIVFRDGEALQHAGK